MRIQLAFLLVVCMQLSGGSVISSHAAAAGETSKSYPKSAPCWMLSSDLQAGDALTLAVVEQVRCHTESGVGQARTTRLIGYDRVRGEVVMRQGAKKGAYLGRVAMRQHDLLPAGTNGTLVARVGAVEVSRSVDVHQAGETGAHVFVGLPGGEIVSVMVSATNNRADSGSSNAVGAP